MLQLETEFHLAKNDSGSVLVTALIGLAVAGIIVLGIISTISTSYKAFHRMSTINQVEALQTSTMTLLINDMSWQNMLNDPANTSLGCLKSGSCSSSAGGPVRILTPKNTLPFNQGAGGYDSLAMSHGFSRQGAPCKSFSKTTPDDSCPWRIDLNWKPNCPAFPCAPESVDITATFSYFATNQSNVLAINSKKFNFTLSRGTSHRAKRLCDAAKGTYIPSTKKCQLGNGITVCPSDKYLRGVKTNGDLICG